MDNSDPTQPGMQQQENLFKPIPGNVPIRINDTTQIPYCYTGLLMMEFPNGKQYIGTAILLAKNNADTQTIYALTCAHNLYSQNDGGKATKVTFARAHNKPFAPYPSVNATDWFYPVEFPLGENPDSDYGLVKLNTVVTLGNTIPFLSVKSDEQLQGMNVQINGYGYYGESMSHATGVITQVDPGSLQYPISTTTGAAGSAIMSTNNTDIVGIHTRSTTSYVNQGTRITATVKASIEGWMI